MDLGDANLMPLCVLGQGTFGRVFLCRCRRCKRPHNCCVKRIIVHNPRVEMKMILEEVYIISQLKHPHIVQFIRSFVHAGTVNIVMEYLPNGTLRDLLNNAPCRALTRSHLHRYFGDILVGLEYLHIRHVIHRDLKPENLMLDTQHRIKIGDFGISAVHTPSKQHLNAAGTPFYMAPEVLSGDKFDFKSDIWALGCVLYEMCTGRSPFQQAASISDLRHVIRVATRPKFNSSNVGATYGVVWSRLCDGMLTYDSQKRLSLLDVCANAALTLSYYQRYFEYKYN